jgi:hypothetical protein
MNDSPADESKDSTVKPVEAAGQSAPVAEGAETPDSGESADQVGPETPVDDVTAQEAVQADAESGVTVSDSGAAASATEAEQAATADAPADTEESVPPADPAAVAPPAGPNEQPVHSAGLPDNLPLLPVFIAAVIVFVGRLFLPFSGTDSMDVYHAVSSALLQDANWGRQGLVAIIEYPPLPTIVLSILGYLRALVTSVAPAGALSDPRMWMIAGSQAAVFLYFVHTVSVYTRGPLRWLLPLALLLVPGVGAPLTAMNPFWVYAVPLAAMVCHAARWEGHGNLRDLVMLAIHGAVLTLGGIAGAVVAFAVLMTVRWFSIRKDAHQKGAATFVLLPFTYALVLYPLFNQLIMEDAFFALKHFLTFTSLAAISRWTLFAAIATAPLGLVVLLTVAPRRVTIVGRLGLVICYCGLINYVISAWAGLYIGGQLLFSGVGLASLVVYFVIGWHHPKEWAVARRFGTAAGVLVSCIIVVPASMIARQHILAVESFKAQSGAPSPEEVLAVIDLQDRWPDGRVLLYDVRTAALYATAGERFVPNLDFNYNVFSETISGKEQFHLLMPPNNGRYFPAGGALAKMSGGDDKLMVEKAWQDSDWTLWRCVRPTRIEDGDGVAAASE